MARVNAFLEAGNDAGRRVSVGGRSRSDEVWAWLNTDNATQSGCSMRVTAEVVGQRAGRRKDDVDTRRTVFSVELPDQTDDNCLVRIREHNARLGDLSRIGATLVAIKGATEIATGKAKQGKLTIKKAAELLREIEELPLNLPNVELPGGVTLKHALACVEVCRRLVQEPPKSN